MHWLLNYTNPATNSISACYKSVHVVEDPPYGHRGGETPLLHHSDTFSDVCSVDGVLMDEWTHANENPFMFGNSEEPWWDEILQARNSLGHDDDFVRENVQAVAAQMARDLAALQRSRSGKSQDGLGFDRGGFESLFTPDNIVKFVELYFESWSPHCPILHRPTFDLTKVHPPLLLAVLLVGQAYSSEVDGVLAQAYYDIAEEYAFNHPKFRVLLQDNFPLSTARSASLEPLQAAYLMVLLQMCGQNMFTRRRVRSSRYSEVLHAARGLKLFESKNEYLDGEQRACVDFDWHGFVAAESRIRLAYLIFGIECNFAMFHSHYPRLAVTEMTGDPMCSERCFSASASAVCEQYAKQEMRFQVRAISTCVSDLLDGDLGVVIQSRSAGLSPMNFFFVLCGLHCVIHASRANGTVKMLHSAIMKALDRWITIWESQMRDLPVAEWKKLGFMRDASPEFWQLARIFVEAETRGLFNTERLRNMDADKMENVSHLLDTFGHRAERA